MSAISAMSEKTMYLPQILQHTRSAVAQRKANADLRLLERAATAHQPRGFARALREKAQRGPAIIAELKKASPSKGLIRAEFDTSQLARELEAGGAAVLSVLTDEKFFQGSLENLRLASEAVKIPCLRKDFMVDEFQVMEARANCADAILLIVAALTDAELRTLRDAARQHGLDVLCEVHGHDELGRALELDCECIGVNSRDLRTFEVSLDRACELAAELPANAVRVAESGIHTGADIERLRGAGYEAFLIGESLMRRPHPGEALAHLLNEAASFGSLAK
jgi:indole-3-glycerol phosphate synthase